MLLILKDTLFLRLKIPDDVVGCSSFKPTRISISKECRAVWEFAIPLGKNAIQRKHLSIDPSEKF